MAEHLSLEEVAGIKEAFQMMDSGNRGKINLEELRNGLQKLGQNVPDTDLQILMDAVSISFRFTSLFLFFFWFEDLNEGLSGIIGYKSSQMCPLFKHIL